jgi:hypothetical protein
MPSRVFVVSEPPASGHSSIFAALHAQLVHRDGPRWTLVEQAGGEEVSAIERSMAEIRSGKDVVLRLGHHDLAEEVGGMLRLEALRACFELAELSALYLLMWPADATDQLSADNIAEHPAMRTIEAEVRRRRRSLPEAESRRLRPYGVDAAVCLRAASRLEIPIVQIGVFELADSAAAKIAARLPRKK